MRKLAIRAKNLWKKEPVAKKPKHACIIVPIYRGLGIVLLEPVFKNR